MKKTVRKTSATKTTDLVPVADLREAFPDMRGLSSRNLKYMRAFAAAWPDPAIAQRVVAQIPWRSNIALLDKLDNSSGKLAPVAREISVMPVMATRTPTNGWRNRLGQGFAQRVQGAIADLRKHLEAVGECGMNGVAEQAAKIQENFEELGA